MTKSQAVAEAARIRLRPILMTTIATVAGHMPLVFVTGAGAKARNSIGLVLVGGMTIGTHLHPLHRALALRPDRATAQRGIDGGIGARREGRVQGEDEACPDAGIRRRLTTGIIPIDRFVQLLHKGLRRQHIE